MNPDSAQLDYEEDVANLKRVWQEIKAPNKRTVKEQSNLDNTATQTRTVNTSNPKGTQDKKTKVIVSQQNIKKTVRNPKNKTEEVIEVVTRPEKVASHAYDKEINRGAPQHIILTNPQSQNLVDTESLKRAITEKDYELSLLRVSNSHNEDRIKRLQGIIESKEQTIDELRIRQRELTNKLSSLNSKEVNFNYGKVEYENYRHDSRRLLKLLKTTTEYNKFAEFALDDDGIRFLTNLNKNVKTKLDSEQTQIHFCTCNKAFIPQALLWVPEKAYDYGKDFIKSRDGSLTQAELQLLLYDLNKIYREREKRIVNHVNALKANEVSKYKRKLQEVSRGKEKAQQNE